MESIVEWIFEHVCCNKSTDMRHICVCDSTYFVCYFSEFCIVKFSGIGRKSCEDDFGFVGMCQFSELCIVYFSIGCFISDKIIYF